MCSQESKPLDWSRYPYPIASIFQKVLKANDPIARFIQMGHLFEVSLRYLSTMVLGMFFHEKKEIPSTQRMLASLERPSLGHWSEILQSLPKKLEKSGALLLPEIKTIYTSKQQGQGIWEAYHAIQFFLGKKREKTPKTFSVASFFELLVAFRNKTKGHGAIQESLVSQLNPLLEIALRETLETMHFLSVYSLVLLADGGSKGNADTRKLMGEVGEIAGALPVYLCNPEGNPWLCLSPMVLWQEKKFWFVNGWVANREVEYLCYDTGELYLADFAPISKIVQNATSLQPDLTKNVKIAISTQKIYEIPADGAVMAQDRNCIFGPPQPIEISMDQDLKQEMKNVIHDLEFKFEPNRLTEVLVSKRPWCTARYLIEGIVYDLEKDPITHEEIVKQTLETCFAKIAELGLTNVAMNPLGTEYDKIPFTIFVEILKSSYEKHRTALSNLAKITIVPREAKQVSPLKEALSKGLGCTF